MGPITQKTYGLTVVPATRSLSQPGAVTAPSSSGGCNADRRDSGTGAQLPSSRNRRDERARAHLPRVEAELSTAGARKDFGPLLLSGPCLGFGGWPVGGT